MQCPAARHRRAARPKLELADVFRAYGDRVGILNGEQADVVRAITNCRTAVLGGHVRVCDSCAHQEISYNSCRNRNCPKCQGLDQLRWLEKQQQLLLPTEYHHVVFTVPDILHPLFRAAPEVAYRLLFTAVAETLREVALRPKNLGAKIGFSCVLHTWTQTLLVHPHIHCIVTGGGLDPEGTRWVSARRGFLFSVRILGQVFRGKLLHKFEQALGKGTLRSSEEDPHDLLRTAARKDWVVYSKPPFAGPQQVLRYLGRYTHRIAISNRRLVSMTNGQVTFEWKDRADGNQSKLMTLEAGEFLRRFLLHVVPKGLMRIRHYGLLANATKRQLIPRCRQLLAVPTEDPPEAKTESSQELLKRLTGHDVTRCPQCGNGSLIVTQVLLALIPRNARGP